MQARAVIMLLFAIVIGGIAAYLVNTQLQPKAGPGDTGATVIDTQHVVVAAADLDIGMHLDKVMLKTVEWPTKAIPKDAFTTIEEAVGEKPRVVLQEMKTDEVVLPYKVSPEGARGGLTPRIPENMRAITISVNEIRGVAGFVLPGNNVDLLLTSTFGKKKSSPVTRTLLQNVLVLGVAQEASQKKDAPRVVKSVTLQVTPKQSQILTLAQTVGTLTLVLRNEGDTEVVGSDSITLSDLSDATEEPPPPKVVEAPKPKPKPVRRVYTPPKVEVIRGLSMERQVVR
ncbi:MAG: Flp pilus assembly protein CpaB [Candidatus Sedimenticola sp. (ex Thyasira tokunagai)]